MDFNSVSKTCPLCGCNLDEKHLSNLGHSHNDGWVFHGDGYLTVKCPKCGPLVVKKMGYKGTPDDYHFGKDTTHVRDIFNIPQNGDKKSTSRMWSI